VKQKPLPKLENVMGFSISQEAQLIGLDHEKMRQVHEKVVNKTMEWFNETFPPTTKIFELTHTKKKLLSLR
jgi:hypothetical protein